MSNMPSITMGGSASPGANVIALGSPSNPTAWTMIPTGGNANNLFIASGNNAAGTLTFMWRNPRTPLTGPAW